MVDYELMNSELEKVLTEVITRILNKKVSVRFEEYEVKERVGMLGSYYWDIYRFSHQLQLNECKLVAKRKKIINRELAKILGRPFKVEVTKYGFIIYALRGG